MNNPKATDGKLTCGRCGAPRDPYKGCSKCGADWPTSEISRVDRYMISISSKYKPTLLIRATEDQERRIAQMTSQQRANFCTIMGG